MYQQARLRQREAKITVILHSDRGCQFTNEENQRFLQGHNLICSMSAVGIVPINAAAESFFGLLKRERIYRRQYRTLAEAHTNIFDYIERFHNPRKRRQSGNTSESGLGFNQTVRGNGAKPDYAKMKKLDEAKPRQAFSFDLVARAQSNSGLQPVPSNDFIAISFIYTPKYTPRYLS